MSADLLELSIAELSLLLREGKASPVDVTQAALDRIAKVDGQLNSFITEILTISMHPYISGVAHRAGYLDKALAYLRRTPGVIFMRGGDILDGYRTLTKVTNG